MLMNNGLPQEYNGDQVDDLPGTGNAATDEVEDDEDDEVADEEGDLEAEEDPGGRRYPARTRALVQHFNPMQEPLARPSGRHEVSVNKGKYVS